MRGENHLVVEYSRAQVFVQRCFVRRRKRKSFVTAVQSFRDVFRERVSYSVLVYIPAEKIVLRLKIRQNPLLLRVFRVLKRDDVLQIHFFFENFQYRDSRHIVRTAYIHSENILSLLVAFLENNVFEFDEIFVLVGEPAQVFPLERFFVRAQVPESLDIDVQPVFHGVFDRRFLRIPGFVVLCPLPELEEPAVLAGGRRRKNKFGVLVARKRRGYSLKNFVQVPYVRGLVDYDGAGGISSQVRAVRAAWKRKYARSAAERHVVETGSIINRPA